jgi:hypothetical protein
MEHRLTNRASHRLRGRCSTHLDAWQGQDGGEDQHSGVAGGAVEPKRMGRAVGIRGKLPIAANLRY